MISVGRMLLAGLLVTAFGASQAGAQSIRPLKVIDSPTAEVMYRGTYDLNALFFPEGGMLIGVEVGLTHHFSLGVNYGGRNLVGAGSPDWNPRVEFNARYQLLSETYGLPALAIGFDSQGYGYYDEELERYQVKSKGFYAVVSRNYSFFGRLGLHGGANFSIEGEDGGRRHNPNLFAAAEKSLSQELTLLAEYDAALNDGGRGTTRGRLNAGVLWTYAQSLRLQVDFRNLLRSDEDRRAQARVINDWSRGIQISYRESF